MSLTQNQQKKGAIAQILPTGLYRIHCDDGQQVVAGVSSQVKHQTVRFILGDRVQVSLSAKDVGRARIIGRE